MLLAAGAEVNAKDHNGQPSLHRAAYSIRIAELRLLLAAGAAVHAKANDGAPPRHWAVWAAVIPQVETFRVLLAAAGHGPQTTAGGGQFRAATDGRLRARAGGGETGQP